jgi:tetratricopeptide (TPR) repeat protein
MKKTFLFVISIFLSSYLLNAQPSCLKDVTYSLVSLKEVPKARKLMEEQCFPGNESSADVWLVRGNVFIQLYDYELERKKKDSKYMIRWPDAIITANESFYKAIELKPDVKPSQGLLDSKDGQVLSAYPISLLATEAMDKKDYNEAIKLFNMVIRSYRVDPKTYAVYLAYAYLDLANCYKAMGDDESYKKNLIDAAKLNTLVPDIYLNLYDLYKQENDTVKCGEILNQARKVIPDSLAIDVRGYELDYFATIGDTVKLRDAATKMFEQYKNNPDVIAIVAAHMVNNKEYVLAQEMIEAGLAIDPNNFDLNQQMTYRYYYEAADYDKIKEDKLNEKPRNFKEAEVALNKANEILETAVIWAEKAYNINANDRQHNIMYRQILVRLQMPVSEELQKKVDSYYQQKD